MSFGHDIGRAMSWVIILWAIVIGAISLGIGIFIGWII